MIIIKKKCTLCKIDKVLGEYNKKSSTKDGLQTKCRDCSKSHSKNYYLNNHAKMIKQIHESRRIRMRENRIRLFNFYKINPCIDCGDNDPIVLELDHVRGKKLKEVSKLISEGWSWKTIENEIKKCEVRCANCHRRKTAKDFKWYKANVN